MRAILVILAALGAVPAGIFAQAAKTEAKQSTDLPCKLTDYRIARSDAKKPPDTVAVFCDGRPLAGFAATAVLYGLQDESVVIPAVETVDMQAPAAKAVSWLVFPLKHSLKAGQDYELRLSGTYARTTNPAVTEHFSGARFRFSTRPDLAVAKTLGVAEVCLTSHIEMQVSDKAKLIDDSHNKKEYALEPASVDPSDYDAKGQINIRNGPSTPGELGPKLELQGVTDAFGQVPAVKPPKPAPPPAAPKSKDAAAWYFNFLHQAGVGITPTWIANIKMAPVFSMLPGGFFVTPSLNVDVGQGQVGQTKTNDLINPKLAVTRLVRTGNRTLQAMRFTPSFSYETNRAGDKRNGLFDGDWRFYISGLNDTKAERTQEAFQQARLLNPDAKLLPQDVPKAKFGYDIQVYLGTEIGGSFTDNTAKSSDKSTSVLVPMYGIRRLRPHLASTFEFWNLTLSISVFPRYLFTPENVTRETTTLLASGKTNQTIFLTTASGWRPYGECTLSYAFDPAGHYSVNTAYKAGSQPPNFDRVNLVQSGILIRF
jgi:hypothetical protein